jgi:ABC-type transport system involved in cytochrome c biogenesis permease subunit
VKSFYQMIVGTLIGLNFVVCTGFTSTYAEEVEKSENPHTQWSFLQAGLIPVQSGGRIKPLDSFAREVILFETGSRNYENWEPIDLIFSWISAPAFWESKKFIRVTREDVRRQLGLDEKRVLFSPHELFNNSNLAQYADRVGKRPQGTEPPGAPQVDPREKEVKALLDRIGLFHGLVSGQGWLLVPKAYPKAWASLVDTDSEGELIRKQFIETLKAYQSENGPEFERSSNLLREAIEGEVPEYRTKFRRVVGAEALYNRTRPFLLAWGFYLVSALLWVLSTGLSETSGTTSWIKRIKRLAFSCMFAAIGCHVFGIVLRCVIAGRPPVTNMYESVMWVSLGIIFFAVILYGIHRQAVIFSVACTLATLALMAGDSAPAILDPSIHPLVPVLRSNYWLTVHVLTITLSYAAFALTLGLANRGSFNCRRHHFRGSLGRLFLGAFLGLGSKRSVGVDHTALLHCYFAWPLCKLGRAVWFCSIICGKFSFGSHGVVWSQLCFGSWVTFVRIFYRWNVLDSRICSSSTIVRSCRYRLSF